MGAPVPDMDPVDQASTEALLGSLRTIAAAERRKHATVLSYWLSIRGNRQFPPIRDLDPLEISDAGPFSLLLELIGSGEDAEVRHIGEAISFGIVAEKVSDAPASSLLSCIASQLPLVAACGSAVAFEDQFQTAHGQMRCWVTLLPFSASETGIDFVYAFASVDASSDASKIVPEPVEETPHGEPDTVEPADIAAPEPFTAPLAQFDHALERASAAAPHPGADNADLDSVLELVAEAADAEPKQVQAPDRPDQDSLGEPGFSPGLASAGFHGRTAPVQAQLPPVSLPEFSQAADVAVESDEAIAEAAGDAVAIEDEEPAEQEPSDLIPTFEESLQSKLAAVRAKADEARTAKLRANAALYEGLSAAYNFALDAEESPEDYLKLVEAQGLRIQLRSPMKPVAKLAFDGMCDDAAISQLEAMLAWAFSQELPRGTLAERIEAEGGIGPILSGQMQAD
jgi:hypothetical protein